MTKSSAKPIKRLEVQSMFEPSRLQQNCLHQAYVYLVPISHQHLASKGAKMEVATLKQNGERNLR